MNFGCVSFGEKEYNKSLSDMEKEVLENAKKQNYISNCGLSAEVTALAIKELQQQKMELLELMHKKIDEL